MKTFLIECKGYDPVAGQEETLYFCTAPLSPFPSSDTLRPNIFYSARVSDIGSIPRAMFGGLRTYGNTALAGGSFDISGADGTLDYLLDWAFDGRSVAFYYGDIGAAFSSFAPVLSGILDLPEFEYSKSRSLIIRFTLRDKWKLLDRPISQNIYAGTNTGATGNEGTEDDIKGRKKPLCFGGSLNIPGVIVNAPGLRWQVHDGAINDVPACYIDGVAQTKVAAPPGAAQYSVDAATGIVTLGSSPAGGQVTFDVQGAKFGGTYYSQVGNLVKNILLSYSPITAGEINSADVTALNALNSAPVEYFADGANDITVGEVIDALLNSIGAYCYFDRLGVLRMGRLFAPESATSIKTLTERDFDEFELVNSEDDDKGVPVWRVKISYAINYTVQTTVAGAVSEARRAWLALDKRIAEDSDATVQDVYQAAPDVVFDTHLVTQADAALEATRVLTLKKVRRRFYRAVVNYLDHAELDMSQVVTVQMPGLMMSAGKKLLITGITDYSPDLGKKTIILWG